MIILREVRGKKSITGFRDEAKALDYLLYVGNKYKNGNYELFDTGTHETIRADEYGEIVYDEYLD